MENARCKIAMDNAIDFVDRVKEVLEELRAKRKGVQ